MARVTKSFKVEEKLWEMFQITVAATNNNYSEVLESLIHDYCIKNKVNLDEAIKDFWEK